MNLKKEEKEQEEKEDLFTLQLELFRVRVRNRAGMQFSSFRPHLIRLNKKKIAYLKQKENFIKKKINLVD
jgi:ribosomal protein L29